MELYQRSIYFDSFYFMDYLKIYNRLIAKAKLQERKKLPRDHSEYVYYEAHHIIPRCMGGSGLCQQWKTHLNIVLLTAREHFLCHWLLHEIYPDNKKLEFALWLMCVKRNTGAKKDYKISSKLYEKFRILHANNASKLHKDKFVSKETRNKIKINNIGKSRNVKEKNPNWNKSPSKETRDKMSKNSSRLGFKGNHTEETKQRLRDLNLGEKNKFFGKKHSIETVEKIRDIKLKNKKLNKSIIQYALDGSFIQKWNGIRVAARALNISSSSISRACSGGSLTAKGFIWKYDH